MTDLDELYRAIRCGDSRGAEESARRALAAGNDAAEVLTAGVIPAMHEVRRLFQARDYYVPELLIACRAMRAAMSHIRPRLAAGGFRRTTLVAVVGLVYQAEELTGSLVADMLEGEGLEVTRSSLAVPVAELAARWRIDQAAAVVLVVPAIGHASGSTCLRSPVREAIQELRRNCADEGRKVVLVGAGADIGPFRPDVQIEDLADVAPAVMRLTLEFAARGQARTEPGNRPFTGQPSC